MEKPLEPEDHGVWAMTELWGLCRITSASSALGMVYVDVPRKQGDRWVWPTRTFVRPREITTVEMRA